VAQGLLELVAVLGLFVHGIGEIAALIAAGLLGLMQSDVGVADQGGGVDGIVRIECHAHADAERAAAVRQGKGSCRAAWIRATMRALSLLCSSAGSSKANSSLPKRARLARRCQPVQALGQQA
jgi:hypothetical protein